MHKVSVVIPIYNVEKYLRQCLDSVVNQTLKDIEIICINDGSTDNSLDILEEYAQDDDRIKIVNLKENMGVSNARNKGIEHASGEYIGFVDPDDYIDTDFYGKLYKKASETNADIVKGNDLNVLYPDGTKVQEEDLSKIKIYKKVYKGIKQYVDDYKSIFGKNIATYTTLPIFNFIKYFWQNKTNYDNSKLSEVKHPVSIEQDVYISLNMTPNEIQNLFAKVEKNKR